MFVHTIECIKHYDQYNREATGFTGTSDATDLDYWLSRPEGMYACICHEVLSSVLYESFCCEANFNDVPCHHVDGGCGCGQQACTACNRY